MEAEEVINALKNVVNQMSRFEIEEVLNCLDFNDIIEYYKNNSEDTTMIGSKYRDEYM